MNKKRSLLVLVLALCAIGVFPNEDEEVISTYDALLEAVQQKLNDGESPTDVIKFVTEQIEGMNLSPEEIEAIFKEINEASCSEGEYLDCTTNPATCKAIPANCPNGEYLSSEFICEVCSACGGEDVHESCSTLCDGENSDEQAICVKNLDRYICKDVSPQVSIGGTITQEDGSDDEIQKRISGNVGGDLDITEATEKSLKNAILSILNETYKTNPLPTVNVSVTFGADGNLIFQVEALNFSQDLLIIVFKQAIEKLGFDATVAGLMTTISQVILNCTDNTNLCKRLNTELANILMDNLITFEDVTCDSDDFVTLTVTGAINNDVLNFIATVYRNLTCSALEANCTTITCSNEKFCNETNNLFSCDCPPNSHMVPCQCFDGFAELSETGCTEITCPLLRIANGNISCTNNDAFDSVCTITCVADYQISNNSTIKCDGTAANKHGNWSPAIPTCDVLQCAAIMHPTNGNSSCSDGKVEIGGFCMFSCNYGYKLVGNSSIKCETGTGGAIWSEAEPTCKEISCPAITGVDNGSTSCATETSGLGVICDITCNDGFSLDGSSQPACMEDGWSGIPTCQQITCTNGTINNGEECPVTNYGLPCNVLCSEGFEHNGNNSEIVCGGDGLTTTGVWSDVNTISCTEIDYCKDKPCNDNQKCNSIRLEMTYKCACNDGFIAPANNDGQDFTCIDISGGGSVSGGIIETVPSLPSGRKKRQAGAGGSITCNATQIEDELVKVAANRSITLLNLQVICDGSDFTINATGANDAVLLTLVYVAFEALGKTIQVDDPIVTEVEFLLEKSECTNCNEIEMILQQHLNNQFIPTSGITCVAVDINFEVTVGGTTIETLDEIKILSTINIALNNCTLENVNECNGTNECVTTDCVDDTDGGYTCTECPDEYFDERAGTLLQGRTCVPKVTLSCGTDSIKVSAYKNYLTSTGFALSEFHLYDPSCKINTTEPEGRVFIEMTDFESCGNEVIENNDQESITYRNFITTLGKGELTTKKYFQFAFQCIYGYSASIELNQGNGFVVNKTQFVIGPTDPITQIQDYPVTLSLMDEHFNGIITNNKVNFGQTIGIQGKVVTNADVSLRLDNCWAQPFNDTTEDARVYFLRGSCPVVANDVNLNIISNGDSKTTQLTVQVFALVESSSVFVFCDVEVCTGTCEISPSNCTNTNRRRRDILSERKQATDNTFQLGPLELKEELDDLKNSVKGLSTVTVAVVVALCMLILAMAAFGVWKYKTQTKSFQRDNFDGL